jgi:hypothetical protein
MNKFIRYLFLLLPFSSYSQTPPVHPSTITKVLFKAGKNRIELEKVISYFKKSGDPLKLKAAYFLIENMDIHFSANYYWADAKGNKIPYSEFNYKDIGTAEKAASMIGAKYPNAKMVAIQVPDIVSIKAGFLIDHINKVFEQRKYPWTKNIPFDVFCEYVLPYRVSVEPVQNWYAQYNSRFKWFKDSVKNAGVQRALYAVGTDYKTWFASTYGIEQRHEPLPRLGGLQLLFRKKGPCEDIADLEVFTLRSQGIPISLNIIPYWATSTGSHFVNTVFDPNMKPIQFDVSRPVPMLNRSLASEPSKVLRTTYSRQKGVLAGFTDAKNIPDGFMRTQNYIDITDQYWETTNVKCSLFQPQNNPKIVYSYILNGLSWKPTWWGTVSGNEVTFNNMSKGVVYLPGYYVKGKMQPAGYPVAVGYHHELVLVPDLKKRRSITVAQQINYLAFQPGKKYKLFYWDNKWTLLNEQTAMPNIRTMTFDNVPDNALLLLVPQYSNRKERPFIITENGTRNWF